MTAVELAAANGDTKMTWRDHEVWDYIEQLNTALVFADRETNLIVRANVYGARHFGMEPSDLRRAPILDLFADAERDVVREALERAAMGEQVTRRETYLLGEGEREFPARVEFTPINVGGAEFIQLRFVDLSLQKQLEAQHREAREFLQHLVESSHMAILTYDLEGSPLSWNTEAERLFGYQREEVVGVGWPDSPMMVASGNDSAGELASLRAAMETCQTARMKEAIVAHRRRRDGSVVITSSVFSPIRNGAGDVIGVGEFLRDVTEQARVEEKARFLRELNRVIVDNIRMGLAVLDLDGRILYVNPSLARMAGITPQALIDRRYTEFAGEGPVRTAIDRVMAEVQETSAATGNSELDASSPQFGRRRYRFQGLPLMYGTKSSRLRGVMLIVEDVTEARTLETQLIQSEKLAAMGQLAAGVAHEIRSPLTTIFNAIYDLRDLVDLENADIREDIDISMEEVRRVQDIINTLLDFARSGSDAGHDRLDLNDLITRTIRLISKEFTNQKVEIRQELDDEEVGFYYPANSMKQILLNLLTNALHAMPSGGTVTIRTRVSEQLIDDAAASGHASEQSTTPTREQHAAGDDAVGATANGNGRRTVGTMILEIADTGCGIPEHVQHNMFDPFYTTKEPGRGTGLGLSVVHTAVQDYGGKIQVESAEDCGTTFRILLPLGIPAEE